MNDKNAHPERDEHGIAPAQVTLSARPSGGANVGEDPSLWRQYRLPIVGLAAAVALLLGVVFVLPGMVDPVEVPRSASSAAPTGETGPASETTGSEAQGPSESPWRDAQFAKARRETQEVLEKLLAKQEELEAIRVELWAEADYSKALELAERADELYQRQEFTDAQALYQDGLAQLNQLLERSEQVFETALKRGQQALVDGEAETATGQFQLAGHIQPGAEAVSKGLERAAVLGDVLAEIDAGEELQRNAELEAAAERYKAARELDPESQLAARRLAEVRQAIADRNFGRQMSTGFAAMSNSNYSTAVGAFEAALDIRPGAEDARRALEQARNESTQSTLQQLLSAARQHEGDEEWQAAVDKYREALAIDQNLVEARVGSIRSGTRAEIDENLEAILAQPERLTTPAVHREYSAYLEEVRGITKPGPRLEQQLTRLEQALHLAQEPVRVQLQSDNATQVTVYRVGELGAFDQTELTLKPGTYTAVGTRKGYRDVRREFTVSATNEPEPVTIQCVEKISQG